MRGLEKYMKVYGYTPPANSFLFSLPDEAYAMTCALVSLLSFIDFSIQ